MAHLRGVLAVVCVSVLVGCECQPRGGLRATVGELGIEWHDDAANVIVSRDARFDFGRALTGQSVGLPLRVLNLGGGSLSLVSLTPESGDPIAFDRFPQAGTPFTVDFAPGPVGPGESVTFPMLFTAQAGQRRYEARLSLAAENVEESPASIVLVAGGEEVGCELPPVLDFGRVPVGETFELGFSIANPSSVDGELEASGIFGQDAAAFGFAPTSPRGRIPLPAKTAVTLTFTFAPTERRAYEARLQLTGLGTCNPSQLTLRGTGSDDLLSWTPSELDFGYVTPGSTATREVSFVNPSNAPVRLVDLQTSHPDFTVEGTTLEVAGGPTPTELRVRCTPADLGPRQGTLTFRTGLTRLPQGSVALRCIGGGPRISVAPHPTLSFGRVGLFPTGTQRRVTIQNVGSRPRLPDVAANLHLGRVTSSGYGQQPYFELAAGPGTTAQELSAVLDSSYDAVNGLVATAGRNAVGLTVALSPMSLGAKSGTLTIHSNDGATPSVTVAITADVQALPPCNLLVSPGVLAFGSVNAPSTRDLLLTVTNRGVAPGDLCYLSDVAIAPSSDAAFSIVGGPIVEKELQPQETWQVRVRVAPTGPAPSSLQALTGALTFNVSSPTQPQVTVPLSATVGPTCLVVTPDPLDFGTVRQGCRSAPRALNVYNSCSTSVTLQSFSMQAAGGQPPGGPQCPGSASCPEFVFVSTPAIPTAGLPISVGAAPVTFQVAYQPIDTGADQGALSLTVLEGGVTVTHLVSLQAQGDPIGQQTDTFQQSLQPKADILLVVDDSGSMADKQASLAANFAAFIAYATSASVDWQIGITTTTASPTHVTSVAPGGLLFRDPARGIPPVLTPATPSVAQLFSAAVNVGTQGSGIERGLESAVLALTPPLISGQNAGFLRADAKLAVVVITDAGDQSLQPVSYYQNRLLNVKGFHQASMFTFNAIAPLAPTQPIPCIYDASHSPVQYQAVVSATGGFIDEICTPNWSNTLQTLGRTAFGYRTQFYLTSVPDTGGGRAIGVAIDGQAVPAGAWTYDAASNSVVFTPSTAPTAGQTLTVTYFPACY